MKDKIEVPREWVESLLVYADKCKEDSEQWENFLLGYIESIRTLLK